VKEVLLLRYNITRDYIRTGNSRSGQKLSSVKFIVSHDTGNPGSSAYANRNYFDRQQPSASAHTFIDDQYILEIIPLNEKAWHVQYNKTTDNRLFGADSNDAAIGVELCHGGKINFQEAYKRYVWYHAYLCDRFNLDPMRHIVAHSRLDPERRSDPQSALQPRGISWNDFLEDVQSVFNQDFNGNSGGSPSEEPAVKGVSTRLPLREGDSGQFVREIQQELIKAGFPLPRFGADGQFGAETEEAVMRFQKRYGLSVDGLVGTNTINQLREVNMQNQATTSVAFPLPQGIFRNGGQGEEVRMIQRALKHLNFNPGNIDGIYGNLTENAVRRFQSMYSALTNDGVYGPNTRKYIQMELNDQ
jgi:N-acetylmuramoyl-L-alanine amidase